MQIIELSNPSKRKRSRKERNLHEQLVEESQESEMMIEIWKSFTDDLLEVVLTLLPIVVLFRFRVICRRWNSLVTSIRFRQCLGEGLVCSLNIIHTSFFLENPFNQCWKGLPCTDSMIINCDFIAIGMLEKQVLVDNRDNYEVFTTSNDATSESQAMITGKMSSHIRVPSYLSPNALTIDIKLLFLGSSLYGIISYNVKSGEWRQILLPKPLNSSDLTLIECNGRLLLTGAVRDGNRSTILIRIWKLYRRVMMMWMEIDRMPSSLCSEFDCDSA
ncbi:hypothetical protein V2J09_021615 [Rumex salicifolius]